MKPSSENISLESNGQYSSDQPSNYHVPMLEKGFELIEAIAKMPNGVTMQRLVGILTISKTTIYRLLTSLTRMGYIYKNDETGEYFLSKKMLKLGLSALGESNIVEQSLPLMRLLRDEIKESVMLGVCMNNKVVLLEQVNGSHAFTFLLHPGTKIEMHSTAPGKLFVAYASKEEQELQLNSIEYKRYNENTISSKRDMKIEIAKILSMGYATDLEEETKGVHCVAAPIFNQFGSITAVIWTSGPSGRLTKEEIVVIKDDIIRTANQISLNLGFK